MVFGSLGEIDSTVAPVESDFDMPEHSYTYIIIGAGLAGAAATEGIREVSYYRTLPDYRQLR